MPGVEPPVNKAGNHWVDEEAGSFREYVVTTRYWLISTGRKRNQRWFCLSMGGVKCSSQISARAAYHNARRSDIRRYGGWYNYGLTEGWGYWDEPEYSLERRVEELRQHKHPSAQAVAFFREGWNRAKRDIAMGKGVLDA
jgi:hypothetical protein